jgi:hypothetical protein
MDPLFFLLVRIEVRLPTRSTGDFLRSLPKF